MKPILLASLIASATCLAQPKIRTEFKTYLTCTDTHYLVINKFGNSLRKVEISVATDENEIITQHRLRYFVTNWSKAGEDLELENEGGLDSYTKDGMEVFPTRRMTFHLNQNHREGKLELPKSYSDKAISQELHFKCEN